MVGSTRGGPAVCVEPAPDLCRGDAAQRLRSERRQELIGKGGSHAPLGRRLVAAAMGLSPRAGDEVPERRDGIAGIFRLVLAAGFRRRQRMALAANLLDRFQLHRTEGYPASPTAGLAQEYPAPPAGRPDPDPETGNARVPDRIFPLAGAKAGNGGVGEPHAFRACHRSALQHGADRLGGVHHHCVGKVGVFECRLWTAVA